MNLKPFDKCDNFMSAPGFVYSNYIQNLFDILLTLVCPKFLGAAMTLYDPQLQLMERGGPNHILKSPGHHFLIGVSGSRS